MTTPVPIERDRLERETLRRRFSDRHSILSDFESLLRQGAGMNVLSLYGVGGAGKSYLVQYVWQEYVADWGRQPLYPNSFVNFARAPTTAPEILWDVAQQLKASWQGRLETIRFDLLFAVWWERVNHRPIADNRALIPSEVGALGEILEDLGLVPLLGIGARSVRLLLRLVSRARRRRRTERVVPWLTIRLKHLGWTGKWKEAIRLLDLPDLERLLPEALGVDLAEASREAHLTTGRIVLFFDTYEIPQDTILLWRGSDVGRTLVQALGEVLLRENANVFLVVSGRNPVRWGQVQRATGEWIPNPQSAWNIGSGGSEEPRRDGAVVSEIEVGPMTEGDSMSYLCDIRGLSEPIAEEVWRSVGGYPLGLATAADLLSDTQQIDLQGLRVQLSGLEPFSEPWESVLNRYLVDRLLEQLVRTGQTGLLTVLRAASVPRWFTDDLMSVLVPVADLEDQLSALRRFSFVQRDPLPRGVSDIPVYRLHPRIRTLLHGSMSIDRQRRQLHQQTLDYMRAMCQKAESQDAEFLYAVEELFHRAVIAPEEGVAEIEKRFEAELSHFRIERCEVLLQMAADLLLPRYLSVGLETRAGRLSLAIGQYRIAIECLSRARRWAIECDAGLITIARILQNLAECQRLSGRFEDALSSFEELEHLTLDVRPADPRASYLCSWGRSLTLKVMDRFGESLDLCEDVDSQIQLLGDLPPGVAAELVSDLELRQAHLQRHRSQLHVYLGDYGQAFDSIAKANADYERLSPESRAHLYGRLLLGHIYRVHGLNGRARALAEEVYSRFDVLGDRRGREESKRLLAQVRQITSRHRRLGSIERMWIDLVNTPLDVTPNAALSGHLGLGEVYRLRGNDNLARKHYEEAARICTDLGGQIEGLFGQLGMAELLRARGDYDGALNLSAEIIRGGHSLGTPWIEMFGHLISAACSPASDKQSFVQAARRDLDRIKPVSDWAFPERSGVEMLADALETGQKVGPIQFNFP